jgi:hypothetical protein
MSKPIVYYWAPSIADDLSAGIALPQDVPQDSQVVLISNTPGPEGVFSYINMLTPNTTTSATSTSIIRSISIVTIGEVDNDDVTFVISGIGTPVDGNGNPTQVIGPITENLVGALAGETVTSANIYTVINSITVTGAEAVGISIGYGPNGITSYYYFDYNRQTPSIYGDSYSLQMLNNETMIVNTYASLNKPQVPNIYGGLDSFGMVNGTSVAFILANPIDENITASFFNSFPFGYAVFWANVSTTTTDSMYFTIYQQGF